MNFEQTQITLYDPQNRDLDLVNELAPFFQCNETWKNSSISGAYLSCAKFIIMRRLTNLGFMCLNKPEEVSTESVDSFGLILCAGMSVQKGYVFPEDDMDFLKDVSRKTQVIVSATLPDIPIYDSVREQFNSVKRALNYFK